MQACVDGRFVHMGGGYYWNKKNGTTMITDFHTGETVPAGVNQEPMDKLGNQRMYDGISLMLSSSSNERGEMIGLRSDEEVSRLIETAIVLFPNNGAYTVVYSQGYVQYVYNEGETEIENHVSQKNGYRAVRLLDQVASYIYLIEVDQRQLAAQFVARFAVGQ